MPPPETGLRTLTAFALIAAGLSGPATGAEPPEPKTFTGHTGWVGGVALNADGSVLATASADGTAKLWDVKTGKELRTLKGHTDAVACVAFSPDGKTLATGSYDHTAKLWDAKTGETKQTLTGHKGVVMCVAFHPKANRLVTGSIDRTLKIWTLSARDDPGTALAHKSWVNAVAFRPDGGMFASASSDATVVLTNLWEGDERTREPKAAEIRSLAWSPDGKLLAAGTRYGITKVWDAEGKEVASLKGKHGGDVWGVAFSPDGKVLAAADGDWNKPSDVVLWDTATWKERARLKHTNEVLCVAFAREKPVLAAGAWDKTVKVWDLTELLKAEK